MGAYKKHEKRDLKIVADIERSISKEFLADRHGITVIRVNQILKEHEQRKRGQAPSYRYYDHTKIARWHRQGKSWRWITQRLGFGTDDADVFRVRIAHYGHLKRRKDRKKPRYGKS